MKKICIYGPESTGKSTLAQQLAHHYHTTWISEYARAYAESKLSPVIFADVEKMARGQLASENAGLKKASKLLFCDTDFITISIYSRHYFGKCPAFVLEMAEQRKYDLYLFTETDIEWEQDSVRDLGHLRDELKTIYLYELTSRNLPFVIISGKGQARLQTAIAAVDAFLQKEKMSEFNETLCCG